ncbi:MAG: DUF4012 domain-containing protein, partial [Rhodococcus sp. (in: high G+C Gram-positive bacteria)]
MDAKSPNNSHSDGSIPEEAPTAPRRWTVRRRVLTGVGIAAVVVVAWFGFSAWQVQHNLTGARDNAQLAKDSLLDGDTEGAQRAAAEARERAVGAQDNLHSVPWSSLAAVPGLGAPFESAQQMSDVVVGLTRDVLAPAVDVGVALSPRDLIGEGGSVQLQPLRDAAPALQETSTAARNLATQAQGIRGAAYLGLVDDARTELQNQTDDVAKLLENTTIGAKVLPAMLGLDGPRSYFLAFQTNAEARATGGLVGGYSVIRASDG